MFSSSGATIVVSTTATSTALNRSFSNTPALTPSVATTMPTSPRGTIPMPTAIAANILSSDQEPEPEIDAGHGQRHDGDRDAEPQERSER